MKAYVKQGDVPSAYLNATLDEKVCLLLSCIYPKKNEENALVHQCPNAFYSLAVSGQVWYLEIKRRMKRINLIPSKLG